MPLEGVQVEPTEELPYREVDVSMEELLRAISEQPPEGVRGFPHARKRTRGVVHEWVRGQIQHILAELQSVHDGEFTPGELRGFAVSKMYCDLFGKSDPLEIIPEYEAEEDDVENTR